MAFKGLLVEVFLVWVCATLILAAQSEIENGKINEGSNSDSVNLKGLNNPNGSDSNSGSVTNNGKRDAVTNGTNGTHQDSSGNGLGSEEHGGEDKKSVLSKSLGSSQGDKSGSSKSGADECDASHSCVDEKNKLIACLKIPGDESVGLSLFVQNKGTGSLMIDIGGPEYVLFEVKKVQLQKGESKKVRVSFEEVNNDTAIVLKAGNGQCNLNFKDFIKLRTSDQRNILQPRLSLNRLLTICGSVLLLIVVVISVIWIYFLLRKRSALEYEKVAADQLPVSIVEKPQSDWNITWDDNWDEEAATTPPSKPLLTLSSKSLTPRKFNKDGGKDN